MFAATVQKGRVFCMPDVCKTPTPAGPVPIPYPNMAMTTLGNPFALKVMIAGSPALTKASKIAISTGDTAGTVGGVASNSIMGKCQFTTASFKVKIMGKPALRQMDQATSNKGNCFGTLIEPSQLKVNIN